MTKWLMDFTEREIQSMLKSNQFKREFRKEVYALYIIKRTERLIIESIPLIANIAIAMGVGTIINKEVNKIVKEHLDTH